MGVKAFKEVGREGEIQLASLHYYHVGEGSAAGGTFCFIRIGLPS